jgi:signal recognition particle subunit SRP54
MLVGLQGTGKTTTAGKLAKWLKSEGKQPMLCACDIYRPAAIDQLEVVGKQVGVPVFTDRNSRNPSDIAQRAIKDAHIQGYNVAIVDTAGRLQIDEELMDELKDLKRNIRPHEILLVVDAMTGQDAVNAAEGFNDALGVDGVIMTKLDGDSRGGAALSTKSVTGKPIKFIGVGEKLDALEPFHPDRMASRILGMGDVLSLIEKVEQEYDDAQAEELERKMRKNEFTLEDFLDQMGQIKKMGGLASLIGMIPGAGKMKDDQLEQGEKDLVKMEAVMRSMTKAERRDPSILNASRRKRIAAGSGQPVSMVNTLIKRYDESRKLMKQYMGGGGKRRIRMPGLPGM